MKINTSKIISSVFMILILSVSSCARQIDNITTSMTETTGATDSKVPESEMVHIVFSLNWILLNDVEPDPGTVKITFPISWLTNAPMVLEGDKPIELSVPKKLFDSHNESNDPMVATVIFPNGYFKGLPEPSYTHTNSPQLVFEQLDTNFFTKPGSNPSPQEIKISAISGPIDWHLTSLVPWLKLSQTDGTATAEGNIIIISVDTSGFGLGTYSTEILATTWIGSSPLNPVVRVFITDAEVGQIPPINILPNSGGTIAEGITIEQSAVAIAVLKTSGGVTWSRTNYNAGDLCLEIKGKLRNTRGQKLYLTFLATGYDEKGNEVSWTLDCGLICGSRYVDVPPDAVIDFTLHLSWAENVKVIKISGHSNQFPFGYFPDTTETPVQ